MNDNFLRDKLEARKEVGSVRSLASKRDLVDFCSNDYLGIVTEKMVDTGEAGQERWHGSTGSRLISGNYPLIEQAEQEMAAFHDAASGLIFNSGYEANLGLLSAVPQRGDTILYDQLSHASLRDGIRLSYARSFSFHHNSLTDLEKRLRAATGRVFVVTESVFSMDGDRPPLREMAALCETFQALLIVDEAHATGVIGERGEGMVQIEALQDRCFARIHTFGKALGCHGAVVLGSALLRNYLLNFCRPFIYTTAPPASMIAAARAAYRLLPGLQSHRQQIRLLISVFREATRELRSLPSDTVIQGIVIPGNEAVKETARFCQENGFDVRPIMSPTVPAGQERLRITLHAFNTADQVRNLVHLLRGRLAKVRKE